VDKKSIETGRQEGRKRRKIRKRKMDVDKRP